MKFTLNLETLLEQMGTEGDWTMEDLGIDIYEVVEMLAEGKLKFGIDFYVMPNGRIVGYLTINIPDKMKTYQIKRGDVE